MHLLASIFLSLAMIIGGTASSAFADEQVTGSDRFKLWNECRSVFLVVEGLPNEAKEIGLRKDAIEVAVRSRLRGARIYLSSLDRPYLYVRVNLVGAAFGVDLTFRKWLNDTNLNQSGMAASWSVSATGTHGNDSNYILGYVSQLTDKFIDEYLRVNADACK